MRDIKEWEDDFIWNEILSLIPIILSTYSKSPSDLSRIQAQRCICQGGQGAFLVLGFLFVLETLKNC